MTAAVVEMSSSAGVGTVDLHTLSDSELEELAETMESQEILDEPAAHSKLGQQVARLLHHGLFKAAEAVKTCGRLGETSTYKCGRMVRTILLAHRRFCCRKCDRHNCKRLFEKHRLYSERLRPGSTLYRVTFTVDQSPLSDSAIRDLEQITVKAIRHWLEGLNDWGFKSLTHYEDGGLVVKGMIALPPGASLPTSPLSISGVTVQIGVGIGPTGFEAMLADILCPTVPGGRGQLRADLMAAFASGNHLRSLGIFVGLAAEQRERQGKENLHLIETESGAGFADLSKIARKPGIWCPVCGPSCPRISVSLEAVDDFDGETPARGREVNRTWSTILELSRRKYTFSPVAGGRSERNR